MFYFLIQWLTNSMDDLTDSVTIIQCFLSSTLSVKSNIGNTQSSWNLAGNTGRFRPKNSATLRISWLSKAILTTSIKRNAASTIFAYYIFDDDCCHPETHQVLLILLLRDNESFLSSLLVISLPIIITLYKRSLFQIVVRTLCSTDVSTQNIHLGSFRTFSWNAITNGHRQHVYESIQKHLSALVMTREKYDQPATTTKNPDTRFNSAITQPCCLLVFHEFWKCWIWQVLELLRWQPSFWGPQNLGDWCLDLMKPWF